MIEDVLISKVLDYAFTALDAGIERKAIIDRVHALEDAGMSPEDVMATLNDERTAAHKALGDELDKGLPSPNSGGGPGEEK